MSNATQSYSEAETAREALKQEAAALNERIHSGTTVTMDTFAGEYLVDGIIEMGGGFKARCYASEEERSVGSGGLSETLKHERTFDLCNDGTWASLMEQAGVGRHPRFRGMEAERLTREIEDLKIDWIELESEYRIHKAGSDILLGWVRPDGVTHHKVYGERFQSSLRHLGASQTVRSGIRLILGYVEEAPEDEAREGNARRTAAEYAPGTV